MTENRVHLIGNLGKEPLVRYLEPTICFARFSLATQAESTINADGWPVSGKVTDWHTIQCFYDLATWVADELRVGDLVEVEGRLTYVTTRGTEHRAPQKHAVILAERIDLLRRPEAPLPAKPTPEQPTDPYGIYRETLSQDPDALPF